MSVGSSTFRVRSGSDTLTPGGWGAQPSGPLPVLVGHASTGPGGGILPTKAALDYVHSLTQTTLLLIGVVVFVLLYRDRPLSGARKLVGRVT